MSQARPSCHRRRGSTTCLLQLCKKRAVKALDKAGVSAAEMAAAAAQATNSRNPSDALWLGIRARCSTDQLDGLNKMWLAETMSHKEVRAGTMLVPMTPRQFTAWADAQCGGVRHTRPAPRYVIEQGLKEDGSQRLRCIDDDRVTGVNDATGEVESPDLISPVWVVMIVVAIAARCMAAGVAMTRCIVALDDMKHAFRTMPQRIQEVSTVHIAPTRAPELRFLCMHHKFGCNEWQRPS